MKKAQKGRPKGSKRLASGKNDQTLQIGALRNILPVGRTGVQQKERCHAFGLGFAQVNWAVMYRGNQQSAAGGGKSLRGGTRPGREEKRSKQSDTKKRGRRDKKEGLN